MNLFEKYREDIEDLKKTKEVIGVILFGSYLSDNVKPLSDLDICVLLEKLF